MQVLVQVSTYQGSILVPVFGATAKSYREHPIQSPLDTNMGGAPKTPKWDPILARVGPGKKTRRPAVGTLTKFNLDSRTGKPEGRKAGLGQVSR